MIEAVREKHAVDPKRILLLGEGEGGTIAALLVCRRPAEFAGVLLVSARWPRYLVADDLLKAKEAETQKGRVAFVAKKDGRYAKGAERAGKQLAGAGFSAKVFLREKGSVAKALAWLME